MIVKLARKQIYKKCLVVLICLLIVGNSAHGTVLCFGVDGHIEIESAFHERCDDVAHSQPADQNQLSYQSDHVKDRHCEPCVDIPLTGNCITKRPTSFVTKKSSPLKILPETIVSVSTNNSVSTYKELIAKLGNPVSDILTSIRTTVLII